MHSNDISFLEELSLLRYQIQLQFGKGIVNANDCNALSSAVFESTGYLVSSQTFRRLFKIIAGEGRISRSTADILSLYCGYPSLEQLVGRQIRLDTRQIDRAQEANIYKAFFDVEVPKIKKGELNVVYFKVINGILKRVFDDKQLYDTLIPLISENPTAHNYLFEQFPYISGFGNGFDSGYKLYLKYKTDAEAQVFGNAMLFLAAMLQNKYVDAKLYYDAICMYSLEALQHPFILARYLGTKIVYHHITGNNTAKQEMLDLLKSRLSPDHSVNRYGFHSFNIEFELLIAEYLCLADCYDLVVEILLPVYQNRDLIPIDMDKGFWLMPMKIMLIRALSYTNRHEEAKALIPLVREINWLVDDYFSIQLLDAKRRMVSDSAEQSAIEKELSELIFKTKFSYFQPLLQE
jgi:hypothetical protein